MAAAVLRRVAAAPVGARAARRGRDGDCVGCAPPPGAGAPKAGASFATSYVDVVSAAPKAGAVFAGGVAVGGVSPASVSVVCEGKPAGSVSLICIALQGRSARVNCAWAVSAKLARVSKHKRRILMRDTTIGVLPGEGAFRGAESFAESARGRLGPRRREESEEKNIITDSKHGGIGCGDLKVSLIPKKFGVLPK